MCVKGLSSCYAWKSVHVCVCVCLRYPHYHNKYGKTAEGFLAYVKEQVGALKKCAQRFTGAFVCVRVCHVCVVEGTTICVFVCVCVSLLGQQNILHAYILGVHCAHEKHARNRRARFVWARVCPYVCVCVCVCECVCVRACVWHTCVAHTGQIGGRGVPMDPLSAERHCALYFEALGNEEEQVFFHADQV